MATKKDLVEAYSFSRRRLVTAFVSGAPGGREVEPTRPGRAIVGGIALAVLLIAGGAVLGILKSPGFANLDEEGLVSEKESGANYAVLQISGSDETELRPLTNITSAMLLFGPDETSERVPRAEIEEKQIGASIGIVDAPAIPPRESALVQTGWSACTGEIDGEPVGIRVEVSDEVDTTPVPDRSFVVRTASGDLYLVAQSEVGTDGVERAYAYPVPDDEATDRILRDVADSSQADAVTVPDQWITLFPAGGPLALDTFALTPDDLAVPWPFRDEIDSGAEAEVGDLLEDGSATYLMTRDGTRELDPFAAAVYRALERPRRDPLAQFTAEQVPGGTTIPDARSLPDAYWPTVVRDRQSAGELCALLDTPGGQPGVVLATTETGSPASAESIGVADVDAVVASGAGAFVQSGSWSEDGPSTPVLIDARGYAYPVGDGQEKELLGYAGVDDVVVPQDWIGLFDVGVTLSVDAARCPPTPEGSCS